METRLAQTPGCTIITSQDPSSVRNRQRPSESDIPPPEATATATPTELLQGETPNRGFDGLQHTSLPEEVCKQPSSRPTAKGTSIKGSSGNQIPSPAKIPSGRLPALSPTNAMGDAAHNTQGSDEPLMYMPFDMEGWEPIKIPLKEGKLCGARAIQESINAIRGADAISFDEVLGNILVSEFNT